MTEPHDHLQEKQKKTSKTKERQFKGLSLTERKQARREKLIEACLTALLTTLRDNPRMARIIYIDAMLVQELHNQATIHETMLRFDRMIQAFVMLMMPHIDRSEREISLVATGLNGYVTQIAIRWVMSGYRQPMQEVLSSCSIVFLSLLQTFAKNGQSAKSK